MRRPRQRGAAVGPPDRLLRLHRHSLASILVTGGTARARAAMARAFHGSSLLRDRPCVVLDCGRGLALLRRALQGWLLLAGGAVGTNPLREAEGGMLFLDRIEELPEDVQQQLLVLARRVQNGERSAVEPLPARLAAGYTGNVGRRHAGILPELLDSLDKIRIDAGADHADGVGTSRRGAVATRNGAAPSPESPTQEASMPDSAIPSRPARCTTKWGVARRGRGLSPARERQELIRLVRMQVREEVEHVLPEFVREHVVRLLAR